MTTITNQQRPLALTIVCWIIIVGSFLAMIGFILIVLLDGLSKFEDTLKLIPFRFKIPIIVVYAYNEVMSALFILGSVAMLERRNWGRIFILVLIPLSFIIQILLIGLVPILFIKVVVACVYVGILLKKSVKQYFYSRI